MCAETGAEQGASTENGSVENVPPVPIAGRREHTQEMAKTTTTTTAKKPERRIQQQRLRFLLGRDVESSCSTLWLLLSLLPRQELTSSSRPEETAKRSRRAR